jgi:flavin reductase (DIM6/NTAB) family NADH-FMN oxidoreductase RutF
MSSAFWLGWRAVLGLGASSKTAGNLQRTKQCVLNLPSEQLAGAVDRLALTTGADPVPEHKVRKGYRHLREKFSHASLTAVPSQTVRPPRVKECPVAMEAIVESVNSLAADDPAQRGNLLVIEVKVTRVHAHEAILAHDSRDHIDPDSWRPLIMSFQKLYGLGHQLRPSQLATVPEHLYRTPDFVAAT